MRCVEPAAVPHFTVNPTRWLSSLPFACPRAPPAPPGGGRALQEAQAVSGPSDRPSLPASGTRCWSLSNPTNSEFPMSADRAETGLAWPQERAGASPHPHPQPPTTSHLSAWHPGLGGLISQALTSCNASPHGPLSRHVGVHGAVGAGLVPWPLDWVPIQPGCPLALHPQLHLPL